MKRKYYYAIPTKPRPGTQRCALLVFGGIACRVAGTVCLYPLFPSVAYFASSINNNGQVPTAVNVQTNAFGYVYHGAYYSNGSLYDVTPNADLFSQAFSINDAGLMTINYNKHPGIYDTNAGTYRFLPTITHALDAMPINAAGDVTFNDDSGSYLEVGPYIYHYATDKLERLPMFVNGTYTSVAAINNKDQLAANIGQRAAYYSDGAFHDIGVLPGGGTSIANAINDSGDVAGQSYYGGTYSQHAFLYHNGGLQDLGTLVPNTSSAAYGMNNAGDIVGNSGDRPFLYRNGQMQDLFALIDPSLGYTAGAATAINDKGWIVGNSPNGPFLLVPNTAGAFYFAVSGSVALDGVDDAGSLPSETFTFTLAPKDGSKPLVQPQVLGTGGTFLLYNVPPGDYTLTVKGSKWLSSSLPVSLTTTGLSGVQLALRGGDANGDNKVDIEDFGVLVTAYGGKKRYGYNARADFNCDGVIDIADFGILVNNYNQTGQ